MNANTTHHILFHRPADTLKYARAAGLNDGPYDQAAAEFVRVRTRDNNDLPASVGHDPDLSISFEARGPQVAALSTQHAREALRLARSAARH